MRVFLCITFIILEIINVKSLLAQGNLDIYYSNCTGCVMGGLDTYSNQQYSSQSPFIFSSVSSDYGPRLTTYDFHGGIDFAHSGAFGDALPAIDGGEIDYIKGAGLKDIVIKGSNFNYAYRHIFTGMTSDAAVSPIHCGRFVLTVVPGVSSYKKYVIIDRILSKAYGALDGTLIDFDVNSDGVSESLTITKYVTEGDLIAPLGNSGRIYSSSQQAYVPYPTHLHLSILEELSESDYLSVRNSYNMSDVNVLNPLEYLEYDTNSYYSNYYVQCENSSNIGGLKRGADYYHAKFKVGVSGSASGSSYSNCVLDIDEVGLQIGSSNLDFHYVKGKNRDAFLRYGGVSTQPTHNPSWVITSGQQGSPIKTGIDPEAYGWSQPFDYFYFKEFVPRVAKSGFDPDANKIAEFGDEAEYADGKYHLRGLMKTVKNREFYSDLIDLEIDNFNPYLKKVSLNNVNSTQSSQWERLPGNNFLTKTSNTLELDTANFVSTDIVLNFSEKVKVDTFILGGVSLDAFPVDGDLVNGQFYSKQWTGLCLLPQFLPENEAEIYVEAVDLQGAELVKNPAIASHHIKSAQAALMPSVAFMPTASNSILGADENHTIYYSGSSSGGGSSDSVLINYSSHLSKDGIGGGSGNSNNIAEPGESIDLNITIANNGNLDAENIEGALSLVYGPGISIIDALESGADISAGTSITFDDFDFEIPASYSQGHIEFKLSITANGDIHDVYFTVPVQIPIPDEPNVIYWDHFVKDGSGGGSGNNNHIAEPGESIDLNVQLKNIGTENASGVKGWLSSNSPYIDFSDTYEYWGTIPDGDTEWESDFDFDIASSTPEGNIEFYLKIKSGSYIWYDTFNIYIPEAPEPLLVYWNHDIDDDNNNSVVEPGESIGLDVQLKNIGDVYAPGVKAYLYCASSYIDIDDSYEYWGGIDAGDTEWESDFNFDVTSNAPEGDVEFYIKIKSGSYVWWDTIFIPVSVPETNVELIYVNHDVKDGSGGGDGNDDGQIQAGEEIDLDVKLKNIGSSNANSVSATLVCNEGGIDITDSYEYWGDIDAGDTEWESDFDFDVSSSISSGQKSFQLLIESDEGIWTEDFDLGVVSDPEIDIVYWDHFVKDGSGGGSGNNNHIAEPGESIDLNVKLKNQESFDVNSVSATLMCYMTHIDITDDYEYWGDIDAGDTEWESDFDFDILSGIPYTSVLFNLMIESDEGVNISSFSLNIGFALPKIAKSDSLESDVFFVLDNLSKKDNVTSTVYPNPSNNGLFNLNFYLKKSECINARVYGAQGELLTKLYDNFLVEAGPHEKLIDISSMSSGIYYLVLHIGEKTEILKLIKN